MSSKKKEMQILIAWEGKLIPLQVTHKPSEKFLEMCESTDDGLVGEYFYEMFREARCAIANLMRNMKKDSDESEEEARKLLKWGFKIKVVKEEDGHELYQIIDDPLKDDSGNPI